MYKYIIVYNRINISYFSNFVIKQIIEPKWKTGNDERSIKQVLEITYYNW